MPELLSQCIFVSIISPGESGFISILSTRQMMIFRARKKAESTRPSISVRGRQNFSGFRGPNSILENQKSCFPRANTIFKSPNLYHL